MKCYGEGVDHKLNLCEECHGTGDEEPPTKERLLTLHCYGIVVHLTGDGGGSISSDLKEDIDTVCSEEAMEATIFNAAMDGIESMILAHAIAGIDVTTPAYLEGIETAVQACGNNAHELGNY
jgi:hypothetical protein